MSLFIAILDDNPADRKQAERLLARERDSRFSSGDVIYFDSYGSEEALLPHCLKYDLILIDITESTRDGMMAAVDLLHHDADCQIILASSKVDYEKKYGSTEDFIFFKKPLLQKDFFQIVELAKKRQTSRTPRLELRGNDSTIYVRPNEILYARDCGYYTIVALSGDRSFHLSDNLVSLKEQLDPSLFLYTDKSTVINLKGVSSYMRNSFRMNDGAVIRFNIFYKRKISRAYAEYIRKNQQSPS